MKKSFKKKWISPQNFPKWAKYLHELAKTYKFLLKNKQNDLNVLLIIAHFIAFRKLMRALFRFRKLDGAVKISFDRGIIRFAQFGNDNDHD